MAAFVIFVGREYWDFLSLGETMAAVRRRCASARSRTRSWKLRFRSEAKHWRFQAFRILTPWKRTNGPLPNSSIAIASNAASVPGAGRSRVIEHREGSMPRWISALVIAILVVVIPFTFILRLMLQLPKPIALSHHRWPLP